MQKITICVATVTFGLQAWCIGIPSSPTWNGSGADSNWGTSGNWSTTPGNGSSLIFGGTSQQTNSNNSLTSVNRVTFNNGGWNISGNALNMSGGIVSTAGAGGPNTWGINTTLTAPQTFTSNSGTLAITGTVTTNGNQLTVGGEGVTTFAGGTTIASDMVVSSLSTLSGNATISGAISGAGRVSPGNSPGILTAAQVDPASDLQFSGVDYYTLLEYNTFVGGTYSVGLDVVAESADFGGGTVDGQVSRFTVIPEPASLALLLFGALAMTRRRKQF